ncbi:MAG TPA: PRC-barrel domain-containing protein [Pseudolabrys sp.]|nr:PRC-barrel domain-containing protein [Pseudolabrys sp.]
MTKKLMLGAALGALMISGALAQSPNTPSSSTPAAAPSQSTGKADIVMAQKPDQWLATKFRGTEVDGADNQKIGAVTDILFDKTGKIEAFVVSVGGLLGIGAKDVALAPTSFEVVPGQNGAADKLKLSMSQDEIKQAQNFAPYQPPRQTTTGSGAPGGLNSLPGAGGPGGRKSSNTPPGSQ